MRVAFFTPNLVLNGVYRWICDLAAHTDPARIEWTGCLLYGYGRADVDCVKTLSRLMPVHCGDPIHWGVVWYTRDNLHIHQSFDEAAAAAAANADIIVTWESDEILERLRPLGLPVVLVSHSTWWRPRGIKTPGSAPLPAHLAAVSEAAAKPFRRGGQPVTVVQSGISLDRCSPSRSREELRREWRVGPSHKVLLSIGRQDQNKNPLTAARIAAKLGYGYKAVICGGDLNRQPMPAVVKYANESLGQTIVIPPVERVGDLYHAADLFVGDSLWESFGNTIVEAWACGLPTLCREGLGVLPEAEQQFGVVSHKYHQELELDGVAEFAAQLMRGEHFVGDVTQRARQAAFTHFSAAAMARRWETYLESLLPQRIQLGTHQRETKVRWRSPERPIRAVLYCRKLDRRLLDLVIGAGAVLTGVVCTEEVVDFPVYCRVHTDFDGPGNTVKWQDLRDGFAKLALESDVAIVSDLPYAATGLEWSNIPAIGLKQDTDQYPQWTEAAAHALSDVSSANMLYAALARTVPQAKPVLGRTVTAFMLCPHIGFGGTERWMEGLFARQRGVTWVGCGTTDASPNTSMVEAFERSYGVLTVAGDDIQAKIESERPDVVVVWGVKNPGKYFPGSYGGKTVCVSHGTEHCGWTRDWLSGAAAYATHHASVSFAAVRAYSPNFQAVADVIYPGIELTSSVRERDVIRDSLGFQPEDRVLVYVGRADPAKKPLLAAKLVARLPPQYKLLHIGDTSEWQKGDFREELDRLVYGRYRLLAHADNVDELLSAADVLVLRSTAESFGLVLMQALKAGCQVLTTERTILGELSIEPTWSGVASTPPLDATLDQLVEAVERMFVVPNKCAAPRSLTQRFSADVAANNFHNYLRYVAASGQTAVGTQLFAVSDRNPAPRGHAAAEPVTCDAVLVLSGRQLQDEVAIESLLKQTNATVFIHATGSAHACETMRQSFPNQWRLSLTPSDTTGTLAWAFQLVLQKKFRSAFVLLTAPDVRSYPERASVTVGHMRSAGLELFVAAGAGPRDWSGIGIRAGTLIDLLLTGSAAVVDLPGLLNTVRGQNRLYQQHVRVLTGIRELPEFVGTVPETPTFSGCVDVVLPYHNQVTFVEEAIRSVLEQEGCEVLLHLIDGGSTEAEAAALLQKYRGRQVRTYRTAASTGQFHGVNAVEQYLETDYLLIQDGDDVSRADRARVSLASLELSNAGLFSAAVTLFGGGPRSLLSSYPYEGCRYYLINPASAIRRSEFVRVGGYFDYGNAARNRTSLDTDFFLRSLAFGVTCQVSCLPLAAYRQHGESAVMNSETGFASAARKHVELDLVRRSKLFPETQGCLAACRGLVTRVE